MNAGVRGVVRCVRRAERPSGARAGSGINNNPNIFQGAKVVRLEVAVRGPEGGRLDGKLFENILSDTDQVTACDGVGGRSIEGQVQSNLVPCGDAMQILVVVELHVGERIMFRDSEQPRQWDAILL